MTRECGSALRMPFSPATSRIAPIEAATPVHIVLTFDEMNCIVS